jgi:hypothetical protein
MVNAKGILANDSLVKKHDKSLETTTVESDINSIDNLTATSKIFLKLTQSKQNISANKTNCFSKSEKLTKKNPQSLHAAHVGFKQSLRVIITIFYFPCVFFWYVFSKYFTSQDYGLKQRKTHHFGFLLLL